MKELNLKEMWENAKKTLEGYKREGIPVHYTTESILDLIKILIRDLDNLKMIKK